MELKRLQEELRKDILQHKAVVEQLRKNPTDPALRLKLAAVQKHIAELGNRQKKSVLAARNAAQTQGSNPGPSGPDDVNNQTFGFLTQHVKPNVKQDHGNAVSSTSHMPLLDAKLKNENAAASAYTLIAINNRPPFVQNKGTHHNQPSSNMPINLSRFASQGPAMQQGKPHSSSSTVLVVSSPNQISIKQELVKPLQQIQQPPVPVSFSSLVSTGGVVTLTGSWSNTPRPAATIVKNNSAAVNAFGRLVPAQQVQIKVPVVQNPGSSLQILMPQNPSVVSQPKSLFRLLPKGRHPIPVNAPQAVVASGGSHNHALAVRPTPQITSSRAGLSQRQHSTILMQNDARNRSQQQVLVQRVGGLQTVPAQTSVTWQDLSSRTPAMHKPSYIPRKAFPNINNGVGAFQKFRILDGRAQVIIPSQQEANLAEMSPLPVGVQEKPRNAALKAVLASSKPIPTTSGMMTLAHLVPPSAPKNGFVQIQQQDTIPVRAPPPKALTTFLPSSANDCPSPFIPIPVTTASTSSFRPVAISSNGRRSRNQTPVVDEEAKAKQSFLRNIDLIPKEQAEKVRGRRFRKRRVAANPVYSGGMYVSNDHDSKRICPDVVANAIESIVAPDVIVKRPRGRPRGSKNLQALRLTSSARGVRGRPPSVTGNVASDVEELRRLKGILDAVKSASKTPTSPVVPGVHVKMEPGDTSAASASNTESCSDKLSAAASRALTAAGVPQPAMPESPGEGGDEHEDQCAICSKTGEVLMCDTCSRVYHLSCATPPLDAVPQGMWVCSECKKEFKESKARTKWPGTVAAVHSYTEFDKRRERDIESRRQQGLETKKVIKALQAQTQSLTAVVMGKVNQKGRSDKEKVALRKEIVDLSATTQGLWSLVMRGPALNS